MQEPICGWPWYRKHQNDHTQQEIESLTITIAVDGTQLTIPNKREAKGMVKDKRKGEL